MDIQTIQQPGSGQQPGAAQAAQSEILLDVRGLKKYFPIQRGLLRRVVGQVKAVDGVSFFIREGETLGLVGESGCGKTTTGRLILRAMEPTEGEVYYRKDGKLVNYLKLPNNELKAFRREMQIIFQDPFSSLNPRMTVMDIVSEPLMIHGEASGDALKMQVRELLEAVGLRAQHMNRYPYAFSGGQRQRIGIARALALRPKLIVCDEPVSALDVSIQAQTLNLLEDLQHQFGLTYLFIAHDLSVVEHISDRVAVMYLGNIVELAASQELYAQPRHPYTEALLSSVPRTDPDHVSRRIVLEGDVPSPANPPSGCKFHPRCRYARDICSQKQPEWEEISPDHWVACHRAAEIKLQGMEA
jgi:peptide/nickel transport system ATP-binding protein